VQGIGFRDRIQEFEARNVQVLGISMDTVEANAAFAQKHQFPYPLLSDTNGTVCRVYDTCLDSDSGRVKRNTYVIDPEGNIRRIYKNVMPEGHIDEVLAELPEQANVAVTANQMPHIDYPEEINCSGKGEKEIMDEQLIQSVENGRNSATGGQNAPDVATVPPE